MVVLSVDAMGGDHGPEVTLPACQTFLDAHPDARILLFGLPGAQGQWSHPRATWHDAESAVAMDDPVEVALRRKKGSSMRLAIEAVRDGQAQAAVSAGNTGALMAIARYVLKTMPGIDRPAIAGHMPNVKQGATTVLDMGANVDCSPEHLFQFAVMGSVLVSAIRDLDSPSVGLLNIGEEDIKGNEIIKTTGELLRQAHQHGLLNFQGNVEGNDIFKGTTDLVVCDGFVGNVALKTSEGLATMVGHFLKQAFSQNVLTRLVALLAMPVLKDFKDRMDHRRHNGAALLGLNGLVFKSHGSADALAFGTALDRAYDAAKHGLLLQVQQRLEEAAPLIEAFNARSTVTSSTAP
jgi:glycerol-3-phosphate acyltransferase PlsX